MAGLLDTLDDLALLIEAEKSVKTGRSINWWRTTKPMTP